MRSRFFDFAHVLFGKPVPTFPEHALETHRSTAETADAPPVLDHAAMLLSTRPIETVRNWEQGKRSPRGPARALLKVIDKAPDVAFAVLRTDAGSANLDDSGRPPQPAPPVDTAV
jgi:hypothetical protein